MKEYTESQELTELKEDIRNWEDWFDVIITECHDCKENKKYYDTLIIKAKDQETKSHPNWFLTRVWLADEKEIEMAEAEELGEVISATQLEISYCPFCGEKLS